MIGKMLAHYEIRASLGRGGMGEVYLARDVKLGRDVALKLLPAALRADPGRRARFEREAQAVAALNHPHVVTLYSVDEADGQPLLVMEFVDGVTLDEEIPATGLPLRRFLDLSIALTDAVAAAHARGITHRDLKPSNVMIDREGRLKVLDFGLAKLLEKPQVSSDDHTIAADADVTGEGTIVGTAAYMSPEQAEGKAVGHRSDVFSLGILLYQMATGRQPFKGDTQLSTLTAVLRDDPPPALQIRPDLPRQIARILRRCLEKSPDRRYESARGLHYDLQALREELDSGEYERPATAAGARRFAGPRPGAPWLVGAAVVAVILAGALWLVPRSRGDGAPSATVASGRPASRTIVVFPFENQGPPEDAYFAAGITDEIVTSLTGIDGLRVVSRASAAHYDRQGKSMAQIAADLGVDYVLDGSVRWQRAQNGASRVRVTPQLVDVTTDQQVWAERYDRAMEEIFTVQSEIAAEVVRSLGVTLAIGDAAGAGREAAPTDDIAAYHAYLRAGDILDGSRFSRDDWLLAVDLLEKAVDRDPRFLAAWVSLARAHAGFCHFDWDRTEERLARAKTAVDRAAALSPESPLSYEATGYYYYWGLKDYERALVAVRRASQLRPDDPGIQELLAYVLRRQEEFGEAATILEHVIDLSPGLPATASHLCETLAIIDRYEDADAWGRRAMELGPDQAMNFTIAAWAAVQAGRPDRAQQYVADIPPFDDPEISSSLQRTLLELRDYPAALRQAQTLPEFVEAQYTVVSTDLATALTYWAMNRPEQARAAFTRAERVLAAHVAAKPDAANIVAAHAVALAGSGRAAEAQAAIARSYGLYPASKDRWIATWRTWDQVLVEMLSGRPEAAIATLAALTTRRTDIMSPALLASSPLLDPLRDHEDFKRLLANSV